MGITPLVLGGVGIGEGLGAILLGIAPGTGARLWTLDCGAGDILTCPDMTGEGPGRDIIVIALCCNCKNFLLDLSKSSKKNNIINLLVAPVLVEVVVYPAL